MNNLSSAEAGLTRTAHQPLVGRNALLDLLAELRDRPVRELRLALPPRPLDWVVRETTVALAAEFAARGAQVRVLHLHDAGRVSSYSHGIRRLAAAGARTRVLSHLPMEVLIAGPDTAVVPANPWLADVGAVVLRGAPSVGTPLHSFEYAWALGDSPVGPGEPGARGPLPLREQEALQLLADGLTDAGIARRTGLSIRTIRRIIAGLMVQLEARSRFQAGVEAARRQWL